MTIIKTALNNFLYATIKPTYWASIRNAVLGLTRLLILVIFHWLFHMYSCKYPLEIADNELKIMQPWDFNMPFAMLVERFHECQQFTTNGNNPFTKLQLINKMLHLIIQTGAFSYIGHKWNNLNNVNKTFLNIITHFTNAEIS